MVPAVLLVEQMDFPKIDAFLRDSLQFLNSANEVDKRIVTVNVDTFLGTVKKPFPAQIINELVDALNSRGVKSIVLLFEPTDFANPDEYFQYVSKIPNVYLDLQRESQWSWGKEYSRSFGRFVEFDTTVDASIGPKDRKSRRAMLAFKDRGETSTIDAIKKIGLNPIDIKHYEYSFQLWETTQAYFKTYRDSAFGNIDSSHLESELLESKIAIVGSFDEWSHFASPSIFDIFGKSKPNDIRANYSSYQAKIANIINFHTTGNYIKQVSFDDTMLIAFLLGLLLFSQISIEKKIVFFVSIIPFAIGIVLLAYLAGSYYVNLSRTIGCFFFIQYLFLPIMFFRVLKKEESKKIVEINSARIDSLLLVSEKVAHDIRSPLSAINLILSRIAFESCEQRDIVKNSIKRIDDVAEKILLKYKTTTGTNYELLENFDISHVINGLVAEKLVISPFIQYKVTLAKQNTAKGHKLEIERVISNILDNSIQALSETEQPQIQIAIKKLKNRISFSISDNGYGIPMDILKLLGSKPVTGKPITSGIGNGIGLLHAKRVIERMQGTLSIETNEGLGTTVTIHLLV